MAFGDLEGLPPALWRAGEVSEGAKYVTLTREELYEKVWATPMRKLAPTYSLSDVGLKKACKTYQVPTPSRGYWAKRTAGKRVKRTPLPTWTREFPPDVVLFFDPDPKRRPLQSDVPDDPVNDTNLLELIRFEEDPKHRIEVPERLRNPHPVIQKYRESHGSASDDNISHRNHQSRAFVGIDVAEDSIPRALRLMSTLFQELENRGHHVGNCPVNSRPSSSPHQVRCFMLNEEFGFVLREKTRMVRLLEGENRHRDIFGPKVRYEHKGEFELRLMSEFAFPTKTWADKKNRKVEDQLNDVIIGMLIEVEKRRERRVWQEEQRAIRLQREEEIRREERIRQIERARVEQFETLSAQWAKAEKLRSFADAVRNEATQRMGQVNKNSELARWLDWAYEYAASIDPLSKPNLPTIGVDS